MLNAVPIVMVRNEALWIQDVLRPALEVFGLALVADTGSTDGTAELVEQAGATVLRLGPQTPAELGRVREHLAAQAQEMGADFGFMIDGDELYCEDTLREIYQVGLPAGKQSGFTAMLTLDLDEHGQYWELDDLFSRQAVFPAGDRWQGNYPFESPACFGRPECFHYWQPPAGYRYHAVHLHRLQRSPADAEVMFRKQKQFQFSMQNRAIPRVRPFDLAAWLRS